MSSFVSGSSFRHTNLMSSSYLVSLALAIVFAALAALHVYWAIAALIAAAARMGSAPRGCLTMRSSVRRDQ